MLCNNSYDFSLPWTTQPRKYILRIFQRILMMAPEVHKELMVAKGVPEDEEPDPGPAVPVVGKLTRWS